MTYLNLLFAMLLFVIGSFGCWNAYRVGVKGRTDLVFLGSGPLPGAGRLRSQFAWLFLLQGIAILLTAVVLLALESIQIMTLMCIATTVIAALRRSMLIRSLELFAQASNNA